MVCGRGGATESPFRFDCCGFLSTWVAGVEENRGVAIFLYTNFRKMDESVEENKGVAVFLYTFYDKIDISVEEN